MFSGQLPVSGSICTVSAAHSDGLALAPDRAHRRRAREGSAGVCHGPCWWGSLAGDVGRRLLADVRQAHLCRGVYDGHGPFGHDVGYLARLQIVMGKSY